MIFPPTTPTYAIHYPDTGLYAFRVATGDLPRLLIFTDRAAALAYEVPGEPVEKPLSEWHRVGIAHGVTITVWHEGGMYCLPPRVGWDFTGEPDRVEAVGL